MNGLIKDWTVKIAVLFKEVFQAFFDIQSNDVAEGAKKVSATVARRTVFFLLDYWASLASAGIVGLMKFYGLTFLQTAIATWLFDFLVAWVLMVTSLKSGQDITLGESFRRVADVLKQKSQIAGRIVFVFLTIKATIWDGPELVVIFFRKELTTTARMSVVLLILTLVQGIFWTWVYSLGYDGIAELVRMITQQPKVTGEILNFGISPVGTAIPL